MSKLLSNFRTTTLLSIALAVSMILASGLSFLGLGIQPPHASWGNMLNGAQQYLANAPWLAIIPGAAITIAVSEASALTAPLRHG